MKPTPLIATATALIGFAAGWLLRPSPEAIDGGLVRDADAAATGNRPGPVIGGKSHVREERPLVLKARGRQGDAESDPELAAAQVKFQRSFGDATERAERARLSRLAEALGLSEEQKAIMDVLLANRRDGFRSLDGGGSTPADMVESASQAERRFEEEVKEVLDPEQYEAFLAFKEREKQNDIEARAQRDLADLIGQIDLSPAQREQALEVLRMGSADAASKRPEGWGLINESLGVLGGGHVTIIEDMGDVMNDPEAMNDPGQVHQRLIEAQRGAMNWKINQLTPILTPGQLAQYRATLEARSSFMEQHSPPSMPKR